MTGTPNYDTDGFDLFDELIAAERAAQQARSNGFLGLAVALDRVASELQAQIAEVSRSSRLHAVEKLTQHRLAGRDALRAVVH